MSIYSFLSEGNKDIVIDEYCIRLKYASNKIEKEDQINYHDIQSLKLLRYNEVYLLSIETDEVIIELNIDIEDLEKLEKCKTLYKKVSSVLQERASEYSISCEYCEDLEGDLILFYIEKINREIKSNRIIYIIALAGIFISLIYLSNI